MNHKQRITLVMTTADAVVAISEGNPGAITACADLMRHAPVVDPQAALRELSPIFSLDALGIYGPHIWMLYKDVCDYNAGKALALLRANQLGQLSTATLKHAIENSGNGLDLDEIVRQVEKRLEHFNVNAKPEEAKT